MSDIIKRYTGEDLDVTYSVKRCIHAAECVRGLPAVFDTRRRPWIQPENADADALVEVILRCPTGALHFERKDGGPAEQIPVRNVIIPTVNGPLYVRGNIQLQTVTGDHFLTDTRVALCRCGASQNKPFCDNSHFQVWFRDGGQVESSGDDVAPVAEHEPLVVRPRTNGPLLLRGDFEIASADGRSIFRGTAVLLCRCGGSKNKPFCDGSHKVNGFVSD